MKTLEEIKRILKENEDLIAKEFKARIIGIFGSYARREQREESDVDILVSFSEGATLLDFIGLADFLEQKLGVKVDIISERAVKPELRERILKEVITI
jgi:predicted nucleotidyltransferase